MAGSGVGNSSTAIAMGNQDSSSRTEPEDGFVLVRGGTFQMGSSSGPDDEKPVYSVTLSSFYMGKYEVTQKEYKSVMGKNPSNPSHGIGNNYPVNTVSWYEAVEYCNALSRKEGLTPVYSGSEDKIRCNFLMPTATVCLQGRSGSLQLGEVLRQAQQPMQAATT